MPRDVKLQDGSSIPVRGLTRREIRECRKKGYNFESLAMISAEEAMDDVFGLILPPVQREALEDMEGKYSMAVWKACLRETFTAPDEEKNS